MARGRQKQLDRIDKKEIKPLSIGYLDPILSNLNLSIKVKADKKL